MEISETRIKPKGNYDSWTTILGSNVMQKGEMSQNNENPYETKVKRPESGQWNSGNSVTRVQPYKTNVKQMKSGKVKIMTPGDVKKHQP